MGRSISTKTEVHLRALTVPRAGLCITRNALDHCSKTTSRALEIMKNLEQIVKTDATRETTLAVGSAIDNFDLSSEDDYEYEDVEYIDASTHFSPKASRDAWVLLKGLISRLTLCSTACYV